MELESDQSFFFFRDEKIIYSSFSASDCILDNISWNRSHAYSFPFSGRGRKEESKRVQTFKRQSGIQSFRWLEFNSQRIESESRWLKKKEGKFFFFLSFFLEQPFSLSSPISSFRLSLRPDNDKCKKAKGEEKREGSRDRRGRKRRAKEDVIGGREGREEEKRDFPSSFLPIDCFWLPRSCTSSFLFAFLPLTQNSSRHSITLPSFQGKKRKKK